ncbi:DsbC family protein [Neisseria montereyensis]|uniref:Thiol:disulfide interchange protein n=1 Tax=Neisseria montereyensis TaxID=2973938 RepID=A0ABT2FC94_9NEIS|nr:DsbC family protein [Neisseria montereyensis]MCS4533175.1 DsbC family protein [Neisseria montereyensis]
MSKKFLYATLPAILLPLLACGQTPVEKSESAPAASAAQSASAASSAAANTGSASDAGASSSAEFTTNIDKKLATSIKTKLEEAYASQNLKVKSVRGTPMDGLYEVVVSGKQIIYTDANAGYLVQGSMLDVKNRKDLTQERVAELNVVDFNALPLAKAIKEVRGNGKLKVAVFSDPDCPFCRRLENEFVKMSDITIYNFMMPIASLHPDAARKAEQIWCQPNPTAAWNTWMREGKLPPQVATCDNPVAETTSLGEQLGFNGTPTLVFPNGRSQSGFSPLPQLLQIIAGNQ